MTAALDAISRIDDGTATVLDRTIAALFDDHASTDWHRRLAAREVTPAGFCPLHGDVLDGYGDCGACFLDHDSAMRRADDL